MSKTLAARLFDLAQKEAFDRANIELGREHLVMAGLRLLADVLGSPEAARAMGIDLDAASAAIDRRYERGKGGHLLSDIPISEEAKNQLLSWAGADSKL